VEAAVVEALAEGHIAGAALDCTEAEPLAADSPLWAILNVLITPHTAGETRRYEDNVIDLLLENLDRLWRRRECAEEPSRSAISRTSRAGCEADRGARPRVGAGGAAA
jgi:phosphoglycerate dehydrogenase-like enzyme